MEKAESDTERTKDQRVAVFANSCCQQVENVTVEAVIRLSNMGRDLK